MISGKSYNKKYIPAGLLVLIAFIFYISSCQKTFTPETKTGNVKITFVNTIKGAPIVFNTINYTNPFAELYTVSKFLYYISNVELPFATGSFKETESYHLVDESKPASLSFSFSAPLNTYSSFSFMLGVDSLKNVSGAQSGALDPTNGMFWTWSTGYIMAKFEGNSTVSTQVNNKVEYHIGGFAGADKVLKNLSLTFPVGKHPMI